MPASILRKPEQQVAIQEIERRYLAAKQKLTEMREEGKTPAHMIDLAKDEQDALGRRLDELRKGAAA